MGTMMHQTSMAMGINASALREYQDRYDRACKRLLSEKEVLAWILHECLDEFKGIPPVEIAAKYIDGNPEVGKSPVHEDDAAGSLVNGLNSEDWSVSEGNVWYDIRFRAVVPTTGEAVGMIVNVEAQGDFYPGYPLLKRATYYCGRIISSQYGRVFANAHYERLQKVCSVWICPNPPASFRNTITRFSMAEQQLVGDAHLNPSEYDLIEMVLACPDGDRQQKGDGLLRLLGTLMASEKSAEERKSIISDEFGIAMTQRLSDEVTEMSNISKGLEEMWYRQGANLGYSEGHDRGFSEGHDRGFSEGRDAGFSEGRDAGFVEGREKGYSEGHDLGYSEGHDLGYSEGHDLGFNEGHEKGILEGKARQREALQALAKKLTEQGRESELAQALLDADLLTRLMKEFGIEYRG